MSTLLSYSFSVAIMLAVLYPIYKIALSKEGFPGYNRGVLLGIYLVSLTYMPIYQRLSAQPDTVAETYSYFPAEEIATTTATLSNTEIEAPEIAQAAFTVESAKRNGGELMTVLLWIYSIGAAVLTVHIAIMWLKVATLIRSGVTHRYKGYNLVVIQYRKIAPFSWLNYLVISEEDLEQDAEMIILHELKHIKCRHWADVLVSQLVIAANWYNPFAWMLHKELRSVHEYQADSAVIGHGVNALEYQMLLIKKASLTSYSPAVNSFNQSKLKDRLNMMWNHDTNPRRRWRVAVMIPAFAIGVFFANCPLVSEARDSLSASAWDFPDEDAPGPEKVQRIFSMAPVKMDSATVVMSDGTKQSVKIESKKSAGTNTAKTNRRNSSARSAAKTASATKKATNTSHNTTYEEIEVSEGTYVSIPTGNGASYFVDGKRVSKSQCTDAMRNSPYRIIIDDNTVEVKTSDEHTIRQAYQEVQRQAQLARAEAEKQRQEAQRQAQQARAEAEKQRQEAQRQAQLARAEAQRQREEAQRQAQQARAKAQKQREKARKSGNDYSYSTSRSSSNGSEIIVIDENGDITVSTTSGDKKISQSSSTKKDIRKIKSFDPNILDGIQQNEITAVSINGEMPDCTISIVAKSKSCRTIKTVVYTDGKPVSTTTTVNYD